MDDWRPLIGHGGQVTDVKFDSDGRIIIRSRQDVEGILDINKDARNHGRASPGGKSLGRHVATVPNSIIYKWLSEDGVDVYDSDHQDGIAKKLNDPDWAYLRVDNRSHIGVSNGVAR